MKAKITSFTVAGLVLAGAYGAVAANWPHAAGVLTMLAMGALSSFGMATRTYVRRHRS